MIKNYIGLKFGKLTIIKKVDCPEHLANKSCTYVECECDCGEVIITRLSLLKTGAKTKCNKFRDNNIDAMIGLKFGKLTILKIDKLFSELNKIKKNGLYISCKCDCGIIKSVPAKRVRRGDISSCGCSKKHLNIDNVKKSSAKKIFRTVYSDGDLTFDEFYYLSQLNCVYCGCQPYNKTNSFLREDHSTEFSKQNGEFIYHGLDRVDPSKGHNKENVVTCCRRCNSFKSDMTLEEFKNIITLIFNNYLCPKLLNNI